MIKDRRLPAQNEFELNALIGFMQERKMRSYAEIGARHGACFDRVVRAMPKGAMAVAVDLPGGLWGTVKSERMLRETCANLRRDGYWVSLQLGNSQSEEVRSVVAMACQKYDLILIDGDHTLDGVTKDWKNYKGLARHIAFHDIVGTGQREKVNNNPVEVPLLWESIKQQYAGLTTEFIAPGSKMGIGIVYVEDER